MVRGTFQDEGFAQVDYDGRASYPMPRGEYEAKHILPPFDDLPSRKEYFISTPCAESRRPVKGSSGARASYSE
ncbi:hypothetical protein KRR38_12365 [Novosphingobium sp. G106]|uniref:hypothetical protein n=1 Tax=Novosphingobium sp. G106 TaxID=2849500 RepID=UPI001C2DA299|nr:hypothetical protein [Novosphingobium sp. G106]MBV1688446.1 hypothetical protein [Novosphingobium sp. G106]